MSDYTFPSIHPMTREVQIALITNKPNVVTDWFDKIWEQTSSYDMDIDGVAITVYYVNQPNGTKEFLFYQEIGDDTIVCAYYNLWMLMRLDFGLPDKAVYDIIKLMVDTKLSIVNTSSMVCIIPETNLTKVEDRLYYI